MKSLLENATSQVEKNQIYKNMNSIESIRDFIANMSHEEVKSKLLNMESVLDDQILEVENLVSTIFTGSKEVVL